MTAQSQGGNNVLRAYVFVMTGGDSDNKWHADRAAIASSVEEAEAEIKGREVAWHPEATYFNNAVAVMQPAVIDYWLRNSNTRDKWVKENGFFSFLKGMFFCQCGDRQTVTHCKQVQTRTGWTAVIYSGDYNISPL